MLGVLSPYSDPVVLAELSPENRKMATFEVAFFDPAGNIAAVDVLPFESPDRKYPDETAMPALAKPLRPGKWTVVVAERGFDTNAFEQQLLVLPIVQGGDDRQHDLPDPTTDYALSELHKHQTIPGMPEAAEANEQKRGTELFDWALDLASDFYNVQETCLVSDAGGKKPFFMRPCEKVSWSSLSRDPKSEVGEVNPATGRLVGAN